MAEKRDSTRFRKRLRLRFGKEIPSTLAYTEDVSLSGVFIKTPNVLQPRSPIAIELEFPDGGTVAMEGVVMWAKRVPLSLIHKVNKSGMGVRIIRMGNGEAYSQFIDGLQALGKRNV
jgi:hypothetical protein